MLSGSEKVRKSVLKKYVFFGLISIILLGITVFWQRDWIKEVLALSESTHVMPTDTTFDASGYDDNSGLIAVGSTEVSLAKDSNWWNLNFKYKRQITVINLGSTEVNSSTPVQVIINLADLGLGTTKVQADLDDVRMVYSIGATHTAISRSYFFQTGATNVATITFPLQSQIGITASNSSYYLYYGNPSATAPSGSGYDIGSTLATLVCPFNGTTTCVDGETPTTATGAIRYSGSKSAMSFDGLNDALTVTLASSISGSDFTIESWYKLPGIGSQFSRLYKSGAGGSVPLFYQGLSMDGSVDGWIDASAGDTSTFLNNSWHHLALVFTTSDMKYHLYLDGSEVTYDTQNTASSVPSLAGEIIFMSSGTTRSVKGYMDELRISDTARYTDTFTPQTVPFESDSNTKLLLHFDENGDDPRNSGVAIDASGNGNHGTISGAKYVSGLVGVDSDSSDTGNVTIHPYTGHQGVFIEEGTTNLITNPSFDHSTYNTNWSLPYLNYSSVGSTFTANMAKRNSAGPFAAGVMVQGDWASTYGTRDIISYIRESEISEGFYPTFDSNQGSIVFWITPEWNGNDGKSHQIFTSGYPNIYASGGGLYLDFTFGKQFGTSISDWTAGTTYSVVARWDLDNTLDGTNYMSISINGSHSFDYTSAIASKDPDATVYVGLFNGQKRADAIIEGLTIYRRPLFDGTYGSDVGNGDEIAAIYNSGSGQDPTLTTGSWDVVFALPTNASTGSLGVGGTGNAWSHPHSSNVLYTDTNDTGGFMMNGVGSSDSWGTVGTDLIDDYADVGSTFTANMAKRNSAGPFAAGVMTQGKWSSPNDNTSDLITVPHGAAVDTGDQYNTYFSEHLDASQGTFVFWITPEWDGNDGKTHYFYYDAFSDNRYIIKDSANNLVFHMISGSVSVDVSSWTAGTTYSVVARWDNDVSIDGTNYKSLSIGDTHTFGRSTAISGQKISGWLTFKLFHTGSGDYPANALIEGFTVYRRPLFDGTYGIDVGNGDEINQIWNAGAGKDPTLITGSWDVVFALPTNASTGSLGVGGTGNAWSHPHSSNVLAGGFMMGVGYTADSWHDVGTPSIVANIGTTEKIYAGGYKVTSDAANEGIGYTLTSLSAGQNYVVRAVAHSDGTSIPKVQIWDDTNDAEITFLTASDAGSSRTVPEIFLFTFELPTTARNGSASDSTAIEVRLLNTQTSGTTYWHQIELLENLFDDPSMETGSGDPWILVGHSNDGLDAGESSRKDSGCHSGDYCYTHASDGQEGQNRSISSPVGFYSTGVWGKKSSGNFCLISPGYSRRNDGYSHWPLAARCLSTTEKYHFMVHDHYSSDSDGQGFKSWYGGSSGYVDDIYTFQLDDVSLTVTPASEANSSESTGLRVDGADTLIQPVSNLTTTEGKIRWKYTPRHSFDIGSSFGIANPVIMNANYDADNYIKVHKSDSSTLQLIAVFGGTQVSVGYTSPTLDANTTYEMEVNYQSGGNLELLIDSVSVGSTSGVVDFSTAPDLIYMGTDNGGAGSNPYDGTYDEPTTASTVTSLDTTDKIFSGGYKTTSVTSSVGIGYSLTSLTAGQNYVVRALAHSDGTAIPKVQIWDDTNDAEITYLTASDAGSSRTVPEVLLFTFELPTNTRNGSASDSTAIEVRLLNTQPTGTTYWHQIELLPNLIDNPSLETGDGDPWIPDGWGNSSLEVSDSSQDVSVYHSGSSSIDLSPDNASEGIFQIFSSSIGKFVTLGGWHKETNANKYKNWSGDLVKQNTLSGTMGSTIPNSLVWTAYFLMGRVTGASPKIWWQTAGPVPAGNLDDLYAVEMNDVSLTVTPASEGNSTESTGLRVDGIDTLTESISGLLSDRGVIKFKMTPRHNFDIGSSFGVSQPVIFEAYGDSDDYLKISKIGSTLVTVVSMAGTTATAHWSSPTLDAGTSYPFIITYTADDNLILNVGGTDRATVAISIGTSFGTIPSTAYFGSDNIGANQYDLTISAFESLTPAENTSTPYYKFGSKSLSIANTGPYADQYTTNISIGNTIAHTLSAYVYDSTSGNVGGDVDSTIASLFFNNSAVGTTYTDMGGGWWRLSGGVTATGTTTPVGVETKAGKSIYVDGVQLEQKVSSGSSTFTSYTDGSLGSGYAWAGTAHDSSSTRTVGNLQYSTDEISTTAGTVTMWIKRIFNETGDHGWGVRARYFGTNGTNDGGGSLTIANDSGNLTCGRSYDGGISLGAVPPLGEWHQVVLTWDAAKTKCYLDGGYVGEQDAVSYIMEALKVGWGQNWSSKAWSEGPISDFRIYDGALSASQIADLYYSGLINHQNGSEAVDRYSSSGTYTSPVIDLSANGSWGVTPWSVTENLSVGGTLAYLTRTSVDNSDWSEWASIGVGGSGINSDPRRYFQWKVDMTAPTSQAETPSMTTMTVSYVEDSTVPTNPSETATAFSTGVGTTALTSASWYNYTSPYFAWEVGVDTAAEGQSASGVAKYHVLLTSDIGATPTDNTSDDCYSETLVNEARTLTIGSGDLSSCTLTDGSYYLLLQTEDNSGNQAVPVNLFNYRYDGTDPIAPASVSSTTVGYSATNSYSFYWPAGSDSGGSAVYGYEYKTGASSGTFSDWQFTANTSTSAVEAYTEGQNVFYVRTVDNASNVSSTTSNIGVAMFYYNESAPTAPTNLAVTPVTTLSSQAAANVFSVSWDKPSTYSGEIAKYHYCVNCTPSSTTMTETISSETVDEALVSIALATQQGKNTFFIVAEDNNTDVSTGYGNRNFDAYAEIDFYASTVAPEAPASLTITDSSDRSNLQWRLTLAWDVGSTTLAIPDYYDVYRSTDASTYSSVGTVSTTAYTDDDLTQGDTYYYKVKAVDDAGSSSLFTSIVSMAPEGRYTAPPSAGGVPSVTAGSSTATVAWTTSRTAYGAVEYGKTTSYGSAGSESTSATDHSIKLTGLTSGTEYHFRTQSLDDSTLVGYDRSDAYSADYSFTTLATPEITDVVVDEVGLDTVTISWKTRTMATTTVHYGLTTEYGSTKDISTTASESVHTARLTNLAHSTLYHFRLKGTTVDEDDIESDDYSFETITFPKVTAYVLKTDQSAGGTTISVAWASNVETSSVIEYQIAKLTDDSQYSIDELTDLTQEELSKVSITTSGEPLQISKAKLATTHVMKVESLKDGAIYVFRLKGRDTYGNEAMSEPIRYVTGADTRPPVITNVTVEAQRSGSGSGSKSQILVSWETDEEATTQILFGQGTGSDYPLSSPEEKGLTKRHTVVLRDLEHTSSYHLKIVSKDKSANQAMSGDLIAVTPGIEESALDVVLSNLEEVFGFLDLGL